MFLTVNGARIFFDVVGSQLVPDGPRMTERPSLLVLHGGPGFDHSLMRPYFDRFADTHQVIFIDHRGNGRSGGARDTWRLAQWGDDIAVFCDTLGIVKPVVLGLSFGGMVAMSYGIRHPHHPSRLVLSSTAARLNLEATYAMMAKLGGPEAATIARQFWTDPTEESRAQYMSVCMPLYNPSRDPALAETRDRAIARFEVMSDFIHGEQRTMDMVADLAKIACPTLVLAGAQDPITPVACAEEIFAAIPTGLARLEVFDDAGHGVQRDQPVRAETVLRTFFAEG